MAVQTRAIKRRIKSVTNTRKITKAMELVAASKMRKAVNEVLGTRPYAKLAWDTVLTISEVTDTSLHPLLKKQEDVKKILIVLMGADRGLAGGFNVNMTRKVYQEVDALGEGIKVEAICIGKRATQAMKKINKPVLASFNDLTNNPKFEDVLPIGRMVIEEFVNGKYDKVLLAYTDYVSAITQTPLVLDLLPLAKPEDVKEIGELTVEGKEAEEITFEKAKEYRFEPSPQAVLDKMLPRLVETMVYQALLESSASEHSARMMAMRSASDAASDMIDSLTFTYNQARQAGITQEIAEISSGKAALEQG